METVQTLSVFVSRSVQKILKAASGRKFQALRDDCQAVLDAIDRDEKAAAARNTALDNADKYFTPFRMACESKNTKLIEISLDCLQKLMAYGYLCGNIACDDDPSKLLIDVVIQTICNCFNDPEDEVHLQIIKALLTAVTSRTCPVHASSLLLAVRTCYNIHLVSKSLVNQTTAKATLTQMLNIVFKRMELTPPPVISSLGAASPSSSASSGVHEEHHVEASSAVDSSSIHPVVDASSSSSSSPSPSPSNSSVSTPRSMLDSSFSSAQQSSHHLPAIDHNGDDFGGREDIMSSSDVVVLSDVLQNDCFLIFRALCKLSMKDIPDHIPADSIEVRRCILSLELLLSVLDNSGPIFRSSEKFVAAIQQYLCMSLSKNCVSSVSTIFRLSLSIFLTLISHFRAHLKSEIGVFFQTVFLRILESNNSAFSQKMLVIQVLYKICQSPQIILDLFVNYDCDLDALNLMERVVNDLTKVMQSSLLLADSGAANSALSSMHSQASQDASMRLLSLESLVTILKSMVEWATEHSPKQSQQSASSPLDDDELNSSASMTPSSSFLPPSAGPNSLFNVTPGGLTSISPSSSDDAIAASDADMASQLERLKARKLEVEQGVSKFNLKPKRGIAYLVQNRIIENTPESIAAFLLTTQGLNRSLVGDYIGEGDEKSIKTMHCFIDALDFSALTFDEALRFFLSDCNFRLPGEAQKIDRMMEKFASRYCLNNPGVFQSADTAYTLAYAIIMLNTDLHNPQVKKKMEKTGFQRQLRGINDGKDLPQEYLSDIYDNILTNEIKLKDENISYEKLVAASSSSFSFSTMINVVGGAASKKRAQAIVEENQQMMQRTQELIRKSAKNQAFYHASNIDHIRSMFQVIWCPLIAAFSVSLEHSTDPHIIRLCLEGLEYGIHISASHYLETERQAFLSSLTKFTNLNNLREIKRKNVESIKILIRVAEREGDYLQSNWLDVLNAISALERMHLIGMGAKPDAAFLQPSQQSQSSRSSSSFTTRMSGGVALEELNSQAVAEAVDTAAIDRIFEKSRELNDDAIIDFVRYLCQVSRDEIQAAEPRLFCMQKLVEVAHFNMGRRIRLVWSQVWSLMSQHFTTVGCHSNMSIAMYAIDALRQLATKFLEKSEFSNYHFQRDFLKPFDVIMSMNQSPGIRELVLRCLTQMIQARATSIKSGWKSILLSFSIAASDSNETIISLGFENVETILRSNYFDQVAEDTFVDVINCLVAFASNTVASSISFKSLNHIRACVQRLCDGEISGFSAASAAAVARSSNNSNNHLPAKPASAVTAPSSSSSSAAAAQYSDDKADLRVWFPILTGLSRLSSDPRADIRHRSLETLFDILDAHGSLFEGGLWELVFRGVLFPIFDDVRHVHDQRELASPRRARQQQHHAGESGQEVEEHEKEEEEEEDEQTRQEVDEWIRTTCQQAMETLVDLFCHYYDRVHALLPEILQLLCSCVRKGVTLAQIGATGLVRLLQSSGSRFPSNVWDQIVDSLHDLFKRTATPTELLCFQEELADIPLSPIRSASPSVSLPFFASSSPSPSPILSSFASSPSVQMQTHPFNNNAPLAVPVTPVKQQQSIPLPPSLSIPSAPSSSLRKFDSMAASVKCQTHLLLIEAVNQILFIQSNSSESYHSPLLSHLESKHCHSLLASLRLSFEGAMTFNNAVDKKVALLRAGYGSEVDLIMTQECSSLSVYLRLLVAMYCSSPESEAEKRESAEEPLVSMMKQIVQLYAQKSEAEADLMDVLPVHLLESTRLVPLVTITIRSFAHDFSAEQFAKHAKYFYQPFAALISAAGPGLASSSESASASSFSTESKELRTCLKQVFARFGTVLLGLEPQ